MKKRVVVVLLVLGIGAGSVFYFAGYRDSYGEQQRRLYNDWLSRNEDETRLIDGLGGGNVLYGIRENEEWESRLKSLREGSDDVPEWDVSVPAVVDVDLMPLEGLTEVELELLAEKEANADACLMLLKPCSGSYRLRYSFNVNSCGVWDYFWNNRKWLHKAVALGRPGAKELLELLDLQEQAIRSSGSPYSDRSKIIRNFNADFTGFAVLEKLVEKGDYHLLRALVRLMPALRGTPKYEGLISEITANNGDVPKKENPSPTALFMEMSKFNQLHDQIVDEEDEPRWELMEQFSGWLGEEFEIDITDYVPRNNSATLERLKNLSRVLEEEADEGDLQSMYWWLKIGVYVHERLDRETWERMFSYSNQLASRGHAGLMNDLLGREEQFIHPFMIGEFYTSGSVEKMKTRISRSLLERGDMGQLEKQMHRYESHQYVFAEYPMLNLGDEYYREAFCRYLPVRAILQPRTYLTIMKSDLDEDVKKRVVDLIREKSAEGYPEALAAMGDLLKEGYLKEGFIDDAARFREACLFYEKAWKACRMYNVSYYVHEDGKLISLAETVALSVLDSLLELYLSDGSEVFDLKRGLELFDEYRGVTDRKVFGSHFEKKINYRVGQLYEKGIGVEKNMEKALECYNNGESEGEAESAVVLARFYEKGDVVRKNVERALELYSKAWDWVRFDSDEQKKIGERIMELRKELE